MLQYQANSSPFFILNKTYCETIEARIAKMGQECTGFCDSYGYELKTSFSSQELDYSLCCTKTQTTSGRRGTHTNGRDYAGIEIQVKGLGSEAQIRCGRNAFLRLFCKPGYKEQLEPPYYVFYKNNSGAELDRRLLKVLAENRIAYFHLNKGKLLIKMHEQVIDPIGFILGMEKLILQL